MCACGHDFWSFNDRSMDSKSAQKPVPIHIFNFDSKAKVLREQMAYEYYGYPLDFLDRYRAGIQKTTAEDVARVARKYIHAEQFATLVVGNPEEIGNQLSALGPVTKWDITIPPPPGEKSRSTGRSETK